LPVLVTSKPRTPDVQTGAEAGYQASCWPATMAQPPASTSWPRAEALALGQLEFYVPKPAWSPDEQFHRAVAESLDEWWRQRGVGRFEAVTVIGADPSARAHEIRDLLTRNNVPFGFLRSDSAQGRAALDRIGVREATAPRSLAPTATGACSTWTCATATAARPSEPRPRACSS
jgi:thioredoxin reductase (NADPH)